MNSRVHQSVVNVSCCVNRYIRLTRYLVLKCHEPKCLTENFSYKCDQAKCHLAKRRQAKSRSAAER